MMRWCRNMVAPLVCALIVVMLAVSCEKEIDFGFKDLCYYHPHTAPVKINVDWSKFRHIEQPTGMTVYVWPQNPEEENFQFLTHNLNAVNLDLEVGKYNSFVFNQSYSEYATLEFHNLDNYNKAEARVKQTKSSWYTTKEPDTKIGEEPEWLAIDCVQDIEVTEEMVKRAEAEYLASIGKEQQARTTKTVNEVANLEPKSIIKKVDIYVHLENLPYLRSALGALEDMAEGCYISSKSTTENHITHTLESWRIVYDKTENGMDDVMKGAIKGSISTFGIPAGHTGTPEENNLYIKLLLVDNETIVSQEFPIGDLLADLNSYDGSKLDENGNPIWPEIHVYWPEPLPVVKPVGSSDGGFDVGVGDWGEEIVTILPML